MWDLGHSQVLFWQRLQRVGDRKKSKVNHPTCKKPKKNQQENFKTYQSIILGVLPCFTQSMQILLAKIDPFQVTRVVSNLFKPTKTRHDSLWLTSTIKSWQWIWGRFWSSNNRLFQTHSKKTESYIQMMQTHESICEKWFRNLNLPKISQIFTIIFNIWGSHSLIEVVPSSLFSGIPTDVLGSTPQRHHVVVWPTEEIALNVWSGWMVLLYISGPSWLPPKRNLLFFSRPNWALKTSSNGKACNFEARQNRWYSVVASSKRVTPWNWQLLPARKLHQKIQSGLAVSFQGIFLNFHPVYIDKPTPWPIKS